MINPEEQQQPGRKDFALLTALGLAMLYVVWGFIEASRIDDVEISRNEYLKFHMWGVFIFCITFWFIQRLPDTKGLLLIIAGFGLVYRVLLIPTNLILEDDVYRYLWDGKVVAHGLNPYQFSPEELLAFADGDSGKAFTGEQKQDLARFVELMKSGVGKHNEFRKIVEQINYPEVPTIYPPFSQFVFAISYFVRPGHVPTLKILVTLFEVAAIVLVFLSLKELGLKQTYILIPAWCPVLLKEFANSGHHDGLAIFAVALAIFCLVKGRNTIAGAAIGLGVLAKVYPGVLLIVFVRRLKLKGCLAFAAVMILGYLPFMGKRTFEGFNTYAKEWQYNAAIFLVVRDVLVPMLKEDGIFGAFISDNGKDDSDPRYLAALTGAKAITGLILLACLLWLAVHPIPDRWPDALRASLGLGALFILAPAINPWYLCVIVPMLALYPSYGLLWFVLLSPLSYTRDIDYVVPHFIRCIEFLPMLPLLVLDYRTLKASAARYGSKFNS